MYRILIFRYVGNGHLLLSFYSYILSQFPPIQRVFFFLAPSLSLFRLEFFHPLDSRFLDFPSLDLLLSSQFSFSRVSSSRVSLFSNCALFLPSLLDFLIFHNWIYNLLADIFKKGGTCIIEEGYMYKKKGYVYQYLFMYSKNIYLSFKINSNTSWLKECFAEYKIFFLLFLKRQTKKREKKNPPPSFRKNPHLRVPKLFSLYAAQTMKERTRFPS